MVKNAIYTLIQNARVLEHQIEQNLREDPVISGLVGEGMLQLVPYGLKGVARGVGGKAYKLRIKKKEIGFRNRVDLFLKNCETVLNQVSINSKTLKMEGNSEVLLRKFNRAKRIKNPIKFIDAMILALEEIESYDLIWNKDIPLELRKRKEAVQQERNKKMDLLNMPRIIKYLEKYPDVQKSIFGAIERLNSKDIECERHCLNSCRVAIENLCRKLGNHSDWKIALKNIYPSETDQRMVKEVWNYLSGRGSHGGHEPTYQEAEHGLKLTITTLEQMTIKKVI